MRLLEPSSLEVRFSFAVYPEMSAHSIYRCGQLSWGFIPLSACRQPGSTAKISSPHKGFELGSPSLFGPGFCRRLPSRRLRYRSQAFSTSQRCFSPYCPPARFQTGNAPGFSPSRGLMPSTKLRWLVTNGIPS